MALIVDAPLVGGIVAEGCYVRIRVQDVLKKNRDDGTFYACADLEVFVDKATADSEDGKALSSPAVDRVKVTGLDLETNGLVQLYTKLKTDLTAAEITWSEE
jgi:hypothetical protein|tara:strand:+ start:839 stop:1144 length:306 start_codon:yes stop_codon:yes gene_type:complete